MPRILHLFPASTFLGPFVDFINNNFPPEDHLFLILGDNSKYQDLSMYNNVISVLKDESKVRIARRLISLFRSSEKVIIHGLFSSKLMVILRYLLTIKPNLNSRFYWVIWGGDLYYYIFRKHTFKTYFYEQLRKGLISKLGNIVALVPGDYSLAKQWYKAIGKHFSVFYPNPVDFSMLETVVNKKENRTNGTAKILLGNSASSSNNHFEAIDLLAKIKNDYFKVLCPLSYGDMEYAKRVINYGNEKLGEKFEAITDFVKPEEYAKTLASVDAAIMYHRRQQAVHNIVALLFLGKKVFLRSEVTTYDWLKKDLGIEVCDAAILNDNVSESTFSNSEEVAKKNREIIEDFFSTENCVQLWNKVFES